MRLRQRLKNWIVRHAVIGAETVAKSDETPGLTKQRERLGIALTDESLFETFALVRNRSDHSFVDTYTPD